MEAVLLSGRSGSLLLPAQQRLPTVPASVSSCQARLAWQPPLHGILAVHESPPSKFALRWVGLVSLGGAQRRGLGVKAVIVFPLAGSLCAGYCCFFLAGGSP
jgi:hypothetical protein